MPTVLTDEELINKAFNESSKMELELPSRLPAIVKAKKREHSRMRLVEKITVGYLESLVKSVPNLDSIHPFYRDMLEILVGLAKTKAALGRISRTARIIHEVNKANIYHLRDARSPSAAADVRRSFFGRVSSLIRGSREDLTILAEMREKMKDLPTADPDVPTVVLAGYPGVGKSTIVCQASTAKPQTRSYPFTTQEIMIGHINVHHLTIQIVDTPGILDRPLPERNKAELLSISALGQLADIIAFIVDVSETNGFFLNDQKQLQEGIRTAYPNKEIVAFFNKIDLASPHQLEEAEQLFGCCVRISAEKGEGIDLFIRTVGEALRRVKKPEMQMG
jgi:nucleolar GTP-binding protein